MLAIALAASLLTYAVVVSQPLAYMVFLRAAQRQLSGAAYIEMRQRINAVMNGRLSWIYLGTLAALVLLITAAWRSGAWTVLAAAAVATGCLFADTHFMLRQSVPINAVVDGWSPADPPADWTDHREKWFAVFGKRQVVLLVGFSSLLVAVAVR